MSAIDRARGCTIRFHPSGFRVIMYKDAPGKYLSEAGDPMSVKLAGEAGFDVDALERARAKQERIREARAKVEAEFATDEEKAEKDLNAGAEAGLRVKHLSRGKYAILDGEKRLTQKPLTKAEAEELLEDLRTGGLKDGSSS